MDYMLDMIQMTNSICGLANSTANVIYNQASNSANSTNLISANCTLVSFLLDCLVSNFSCAFMQNYFNGKHRRESSRGVFLNLTDILYLVSGVTRVGHYASVYSFENPQPQLLQRFVFSFLSGVNGKQRLGSDNQPVSCQTIKDCASGEYCIKSKCVSTLTTYHEAYGTGLQYDESKGLVQVLDPTKGTFTEST